MMQKVKPFLDTLAVIMVIMSSAAVTIGVSIYVMRLPPVAYKSDISKVEQTAVTALATTQKEEKRQDAASALVKTAVGTHGEKIKSANDRIAKAEKDVADLQGRVAALRKSQTVEQGEIDSMRSRRGQ